MCCQLEDCYAILTDVPLQTISVFKQLLTTGHSSALGIDTLESLTEFLPDLKLEKTQFCCIPTNDTKMNLMKLGLIVKNLRMYFITWLKMLLSMIHLRAEQMEVSLKPTK